MKFQKIFPIFIYLILIAYIFQFRYKLDKFGPYFTSDGAIKVYQTFQYKQNGFFSLGCIYPGKSYDSEFRFYPISYPWAVFSKEKVNEKCVLEYPPFFYWIGAFLLYLVPLSLILYIPILFYSVAIFLFDRILENLGFNSLFRVFIVLLSFFSFPLLTSLDYTESSLFLLLYLYGFSRLVGILKDQSKCSWKNYFLFGGIIGLAFCLRLEILFPFAFVLLIYFLLYKKLIPTVSMGLGFLITISFFLIYNYNVSGHILGFRYVSSIDLNENSSANFISRIQLLKAYLWGDHLMIGILRFNPLCYFMLFLTGISIIFWKNRKEGNVFLFSGIFSILCIPFYVTFYGGVGYFGLRYLEAPFFLIVIGFSYYLADHKIITDKFFKKITFVILGFIFYFNLVTTREGLKVLRSSSADLHTLHTEFNKSPQFIFHTSLYSSIWMGYSFLNKIHVLTYTTPLFDEYLKNLDKGEVFMIIKSPKDIYISSDIPKKLFSQYKTNVDINSEKAEIIEEKDLFGVKLILAKRK